MKKEMIKYKEGLFVKIKNFFSNLFKKKNTQEVSTEQEQQNNFKESVKITVDEEEQKIINLQKNYQAGLVKEEDMTDEEHTKLKELYRKQNQDLKNEIEDRKQKIKKKIDNMNE